MKYIKLYEVFNHSKNETERMENIKDICLELTDIGMRVNLESDNFIIFNAAFETVSVESGTVRKYKEYNWSDIKDCVLRLKDYLGNNYEKFWYKTDPSSIGWREIELDENTEIDKIITSVAIRYRKID